MAEQEGSVDPQRLSIDQAAKVMAAALKRRIDAEKVRQGIEDGAPTNGDGTLSLVQARMQRPIVAEMDWGRRRGPMATREVLPASDPNAASSVAMTRQVETIRETDFFFVFPIDFGRDH